MDLLIVGLFIWLGSALLGLFAAIITVEYTTVVVEKSKWVPVPLSAIVKAVFWPITILFHFLKAFVFYIVKHVGQIKAQLKSDIATFDKTASSVGAELGKLGTQALKEAKTLASEGVQLVEETIHPTPAPAASSTTTPATASQTVPATVVNTPSPTSNSGSSTSAVPPTNATGK